MDNRNMEYKYVEIIFLSLLLLQQHKQSKEDVRLGGGTAHLKALPACFQYPRQGH